MHDMCVYLYLPYMTMYMKSIKNIIFICTCISMNMYLYILFMAIHIYVCVSE